MKKIILFILMIIASVNIFSNELPDGLPDELYFYYKKACYFKNLVLEDIKHNDIVEIDKGYYLGMLDNESFGHLTYKVKEAKNSEREIIIIFNKGDVYHFVLSYAKDLSGHLLTFCNIRIFNKEDALICEVDYHLEDDNVIYRCYFDPKTFTYYNQYE